MNFVCAIRLRPQADGSATIGFFCRFKSKQGGRFGELLTRIKARDASTLPFLWLLVQRPASSR
jgi:hypothetical protein